MLFDELMAQYNRFLTIRAEGTIVNKMDNRERILAIVRKVSKKPRFPIRTNRSSIPDSSIRSRCPIW